jgi:hypothetical protein
MPPAAITGTPIASTTCGTSASVPTGPSSPLTRKLPRWPPALGALGNHRVGPALGEMLGLGDRRRTRQDAAARRPSRVHGRPIRQAEVEAGHDQPCHRDARAATPGRVSTPTTL